VDTAHLDVWGAGMPPARANEALNVTFGVPLAIQGPSFCTELYRLTTIRTASLPGERR